MSEFTPPSHQPILLAEVVAGLRPQPGGRYIDCTVGSGGHAWALLRASSPTGQLLGLDADPAALERARQRLAEFADRFELFHTNFEHMLTVARQHNFDQVDGILMDLGLSSDQLDTPERGFAFSHSGPLDMRFDPKQPLSAAEIVNEWPEEEIADILWRYGEERFSRRIARRIINSRPIHTTDHLADIVTAALSPKQRRQGIHPATRAFQALRIAVNDELGVLERALPQAVELLRPGGRLAVISFHSLEDRIVKQFIQRESRDCICPPRQPMCTCGHKATLRPITRKPIRPQADEIASNPRSRSARLRVAERVAATQESMLQEEEV